LQLGATIHDPRRERVHHRLRCMRPLACPQANARPDRLKIGPRDRLRANHSKSRDSLLALHLSELKRHTCPVSEPNPGPLSHEPTTYHGPVESHRSIMARRSLPQNGSPSTKIQGEPNTPRATAASPCWRAIAFTSGSSIPASTKSRSMPSSDDATCAIA